MLYKTFSPILLAGTHISFSFSVYLGGTACWNSGTCQWLRHLRSKKGTVPFLERVGGPKCTEFVRKERQTNRFSAVIPGSATPEAEYTALRTTALLGGNTTLGERND